MHYLTRAMFLLTLFFSIFSNLILEGGVQNKDSFENSSCFFEKSDTLNKIYLSASQIIIEDKEIYIDLSRLGNDLLAVESLLCDELGIYILLRNDPDCGHDMYCSSCGGCNPKNRCSYRCKCTRR